jgi:glycosyltransferase involved in cell wall biosynthesis
MTLHLLTGEYGPDTGGVGAYSHVLAQALMGRGLRVRVWNTLDGTLQQSLPDALATDPGFVLLQYVPNALGAKGGNVAFCQWLLSLRRKGTDIRVMFHEPYFYLSWNPALNTLAMVQRMMAAILLRASSRIYISTEQWRRYLVSYAPTGTAFTVLPIPSTLPSDPPTDAIAAWRARLLGEHRLLAGHFGTYGEHVALELAPIIPGLLERITDLRFVCVGRGSERFVERLVFRYPRMAGRVQATGALDPPDAASALAACDLALQPFPDGVTTRRTSVMAPLALGVPIVTSRGFLTEPLWSETPAVVLAAASDPQAHVDAAVSLLRDESTRTQLGGLGRRLYDRQFALERTVQVLMGDRE